MKTNAINHSKYNINYHLVWCPKYRHQVLTGQIEAYLKRLIYNICDHYKYEAWTMEQRLLCGNCRRGVCGNYPKVYRESEVSVIVFVMGIRTPHKYRAYILAHEERGFTRDLINKKSHWVGWVIILLSL